VPEPQQHRRRIAWEKPPGVHRGFLEDALDGEIDPDEMAEREAIQWEGQHVTRQGYDGKGRDLQQETA
jgi:hypothetical protein